MATSTLIEELTDESLMPFGKFKNKRMIDVPAVYLMWLAKEGCSHAAVSRYITKNYEVLSIEAANAKNYKR